MDLFKSRRKAVPELDDDFLPQPIDADNSVFLDSLETVTPEELAPDAGRNGESMSDRLYQLVRMILLTVCIGICAFCVWLMIDHYTEMNRTDDFYSNLSSQLFADEAELGDTGINRMLAPIQAAALPVFADAQAAEESGTVGGITPTQSYNLKFERMKALLVDLAAENPDTFGFIHIEGTNISYPIVQGKDNDHYLDYQSNGMPSVSGSIFADYRCNRSLMDDGNLILYGHNMTNGTMFNNVMNFFTESVFYNTKIEIYTFDGLYTYEPFTIFRTNSRFPYFTTYFPEKQTMIDFCELMQAQSSINRGLTFTGEEKILTLSTCTNIGDGRYALHARLVKVER